ncbi:MAG: hypothetical protein IJP92_10335 [Lachnospiraceae bacterium]|nr:hypothetical protein [Lachnospiraceae bacterium]
MEKKLSKEQLLHVADVLFLAVSACYFVFGTGVLNDYYAARYEQVAEALVYFLLATAVCRLVLLWPQQKNRILGACALSFIMAAISFLGGAGHPGFFAVLVLGCAGIRFEYFAGTGTLVWIWYTLGMIFGCLSGFFSNIVYVREGVTRSSWGFGHPVTLSVHVLFSVALLWVSFRAIPDVVILLLSLLSFWIARDIAYSETGWICSALLIVLVLYHMLPVERWLSGGWKQKLLRTADVLMSLSFPLLAGLYFVLVYRFKAGSEWAISVNRWITGRLGLALEAFGEFGVPAFGAYYRINALTGTQYNVVDSFYPLAVIRYGWVFLLVMAVVWVFLMLRAFRNGNRRIAYVMLLAAVYSFSEPLLENAYLNVFFCLAFSVLPTERNRTGLPTAEGEERKEDKRAGIAAAGAVALICLLLILLLPTVFSYVRTVYLRFGWVGKDERVFLMIAVVFLLLGAFLAGINRLVYSLWRKQKPSRTTWILTVIGLCLLSAGGWHVSRMVRAEQETYVPETDKVAPVMETVLAASEGRVIADTLPEVFADRFPGVSRTWKRGEELAFEKDTTVIASRWVDQQRLIGMGYRYLQMSDIFSLYTNDAAVVRALREAGYHIASFYYSESVQRFSGPEDNFQGVLLKIPEKPVSDAVRISMYGGEYTVEFDLHFDGGRPQHDLRGEEICTLRAYSVNNDKWITERTVMGEEVGESGWNTYSLSVNARGHVELSVAVNETYAMRLTEVRYRKTPEYDVFDTKDEEGRIIRREYYDLEGNPAVTANGASILTYEYDEAGNNTVQYFFDADDHPVVTEKGYAGLHRVYDGQKRVIRESYTDTKDLPVMLPEGYAAVETEYDAAGNAAVHRYYDADDRPVMIDKGYAERHRRYQDKRVIREAYLDTEGNPVAIAAGYAAYEAEYDAAGNATVHRYYDTDGRPVMISTGYAERRRVYDQDKHVIREAYLDTEGNPVSIPPGYAAYEAEYDAAGNANLYRYYGADGKPVLIGNGYAELHRVFDEKKQITEESYYDGDGNPVMMADGYAVDEREYDTAGNLVTQRFYDTARAPVMTANGIFEVRRQYDDSNRLIWEEYCDTEGNPATRTDGVWAFARIYAEDGSIAEEAYYDAEGEPFVPETKEN